MAPSPDAATRLVGDAGSEVLAVSWTAQKSGFVGSNGNRMNTEFGIAELTGHGAAFAIVVVCVVFGLISERTGITCAGPFEVLEPMKKSSSVTVATICSQ